ncbi:serine threonine kinase [Fusarium albosuccineum]|uniref:Serine threonine kinase n=1 Tax=Fusarium albosuccineum TaxID=1237068 RepID=A0A8H4KP08_9HYPO|nr:serine threonine kinase [Fusarium albosuccineum]
MARLIAVALHHRDRFSQGSARRTFGYEAYHWGIMIVSEASQGQDCCSFDATDASEIDPVTFRMTNPTMDWWFRVKEDVDIGLCEKLIGRVVIGQVPDEVSSAEVRGLFARIPLPEKNTNPQQSCVSWTVDAIRALQSQGWAQSFRVDEFKDWALSYADERMKGSDSSEPSVKNYRA